MQAKKRRVRLRKPLFCLGSPLGRPNAATETCDPPSGTKPPIRGEPEAGTPNPASRVRPPRMEKLKKKIAAGRAARPLCDTGVIFSARLDAPMGSAEARTPPDKPTAGGHERLVGMVLSPPTPGAPRRIRANGGDRRPRRRAGAMRGAAGSPRPRSGRRDGGIWVKGLTACCQQAKPPAPGQSHEKVSR